MNKSLVVYIVIIISVCCVSCTQTKDSDTKNTRTITDMLGREVVIPQEVDKIVGIRAGSLRILVYMDAMEMIAGVEETEKTTERIYIQAHPELQKKESIGPQMGGDAELIMLAKPDVIFTSYTTVEEANALQEKTAIPVVAIECPELGTDRELLYASFELIGEVIHKEERAQEMIALFEDNIHRLDSITKSENKTTAYIGGVSYSGSYGITSTQAYYPAFSYANVNNVANQIDKSLVSHVKGTFIDIEQLILWDPAYIFIDNGGLSIIKQDVEQNPDLYKTLSAVKNNHVYTLLPYNNYATNYILQVVNAWYIASVVYADKMETVDIEAAINKVLKTVYGEKINYNTIKDKLKAVDLFE